MGSLLLRGSLDVGSDCGGCGGGGGCAGGGTDRTVRALGLRCPGSAYYQSVVATGAPIRVQTVGVLGAEFVDLDLLADLIGVEFLYVKSDAPIALRLDAAAARVVGSGGTFPTGFVGGETLTFLVGLVPVSVTFLAGDQTAAQVVARINAACALAGLPTPRASVSGTQIAIDGLLTGPQSTVSVTGGTGAATLGLAGASAVGSGQDVEINGSFLAEFRSYPDSVSRVQVSGQASLSIVAAGRTSA